MSAEKVGQSLEELTNRLKIIEAGDEFTITDLWQPYLWRKVTQGQRSLYGKVITEYAEKLGVEGTGMKDIHNRKIYRKL